MSSEPEVPACLCVLSAGITKVCHRALLFCVNTVSHAFELNSSSTEHLDLRYLPKGTRAKGLASLPATLRELKDVGLNEGKLGRWDADPLAFPSRLFVSHMMSIWAPACTRPCALCLPKLITSGPENHGQKPL